MRKVLSLFLCVVLLFAVSSCSSDKTVIQTTTENAPVEIALSKSNYSAYLNFDKRYSETESTILLGLPSKKGNYSLSIYPIQPGSFSNVSITIKLYVSEPWLFHDTTDSNNSYKTISLKLPTDGEYDLTTSIGGIDRNSPWLSNTVESISGKFISAT